MLTPEEAEKIAETADRTVKTFMESALGQTLKEWDPTDRSEFSSALLTIVMVREIYDAAVAGQTIVRENDISHHVFVATVLSLLEVGGHLPRTSRSEVFGGAI